jgi:hypothetical protein
MPHSLKRLELNIELSSESSIELELVKRAGKRAMPEHLILSILYIPYVYTYNFFNFYYSIY